MGQSGRRIAAESLGLPSAARGDARGVEMKKLDLAKLQKAFAGK
jgi:hypothetical protein